MIIYDNHINDRSDKHKEQMKNHANYRTCNFPPRVFKQLLKSHQPVRATSGLGFSFHPPSLQLFLSSSAPSSNSGGMVYPSSFLLPWLQNRPGARWRSRQYAICSPSWSSSFFHHHFFNTLFIDFDSILDPNLEPNSLQKRF